jgi:peptide/nickel transport system substrate-binding protein
MALCVPLALATGCDTQGSSDAHPVSGGHLTFATGSEPECLDPQVSPYDVTALIDRNIFDSLVWVGADGRARPWLARSWKISKDRKTYTFTLRQGVRFHDGTPLNAEAVKATLDHAVDPKTKSQYAASLLEGYAGATVVSDDTVRVRLSRPSTPLLQALSTAYLGIQSPKAIRAGAQQLCAHPVGTGPFTFVSWARHKNITLTRNPRYAWGPPSAAHSGPARLATLTIGFMAEDSVRYGALTSGQAQVIDGLPPVNAKSVASAGKRLLRAKLPGVPYTMFFNTRKGPLSDERVRRAVLGAVNVDQLVKAVYFGVYARAWSPLSPATQGYDKGAENSWRFDPAAANRLLDEAGWTGRDAAGYRTKDGKRLTLKWPVAADTTRDKRDVLGQGIQAQLKGVGIHLDLENMDPGAFAKAIFGVDLDVWASSWGRAEPDILRHYFSGKGPAEGGGDVFHAGREPLTGMLESAVREDDPAARARDYAQAQQYILRHAMAMPIYVPEYLVGAAKNVHGITFDPQAYPVFYDVWLAT